MARKTEPPGTLGSWHWAVKKKKLKIETSESGAVSDLNGEWSLRDLGAMLEGLSKPRLSKALATKDGLIECSITLSNGRKLRLVGAYVGQNNARGIVLSEFDSSDDPSSPGPELRPVYQPIISLREGNVAGFEALARWADNKKLAKRFDETGLASSMLIQATETLVKLRETSGRDDLFMHVNVTARDLARSRIADIVQALMLGHDLPHRSIRIELTEQAALRDSAAAIEAAKEIREAGGGLVLDDFGSGHSSFAWLADLPADGLKIDADLTRRLGDPRTDTILEALALLSRRLKMSITAEGIEEKKDAAKMRDLGYNYAQGYAFSEPLVVADAIEFLMQSEIA